MIVRSNPRSYRNSWRDYSVFGRSAKVFWNGLAPNIAAPSFVNKALCPVYFAGLDPAI